MSKGKLTPKQALFAQEYLVDLNATAAAIRAGYSAKTAEQQGYRLLRNVQVAAAIQAGMSKRSAKAEVKAEQIVAELRRIAFGDSRRVMEWGPNGVKLKPSSELSDDDAAIVSEASESTTLNGGSLKLKTHDKIRALELLGKHIGMFTDNLNVGGSVTLEIVEELESANPGTPEGKGQAALGPTEISPK